MSGQVTMNSKVVLRNGTIDSKLSKLRKLSSIKKGKREISGLFGLHVIKQHEKS